MVKPEIPKEKLTEIKGALHVSWRMLKIVWQIDPKLFIGAFVSTIIPGIVPFINIYIYKLIIDFVVAAASSGTYNISSLYPLIALRILTYFIQDAAYKTEEFVARLYWTKVPIFLNQLFLKKLTSLDMQYFEDDKFSDKMEKVRDSINYRPQQLIENLFFSFQSAIQFLIALVALIKLNWLFIILILAVTIPEFINQSIYSKQGWNIWSVNSPFRKRFIYLMHILQGPRDFKEVKLYRLAGKLLLELKSIQEKFYFDNKKISQKYYGTSLAFNVLSALIFVGVEVFVIFQALARKVTVGDISFYTGVVSNFQNGLGGFLRNINQIFENSLYVKSIFDIIDAEPILKQAEHPVALRFKNAPKIEFKNVTFAYPDTKQKILRDFSLVINPGEKIAFVGENGAGKTTVIKLLARFYDVSEGEILINGKNIKDINIASWYDRFGVLFQDFNKYEHSVKENIHFGNVNQRMVVKNVIEAATSSGAHAMISKFDKGYDQMLGKMFEGGVELSGGQWQKIALSRAFYRNAPVLVLDEPTASIDAKAESEIFSRVEKLSKNKTVIIISHRFSTVRNADKIYVLDKGKIIEGGTHEQLMKLGGQYFTMFSLQAKGYQ